MKKEVKNALMAAVIVLAIGVVALRMFRGGGGGGPAPLPTDYTIEGVCMACKAQARLTQNLRERPPFECATCKKAAVYPWMYCPDCRYRFIPNLEKSENGPPRFPVVPACTHCGKARGTGYDSRDTDQKPVGDAPLPKWQ